uniref:Probable L-asparaginase 2 n=1 Tax=Crassostrea virginica TaxID=6565 RepID=A0A8B8DNN1_CRAVI|nr:probable L-asparaginase 2 [Crassostrea virginica]
MDEKPSILLIQTGGTIDKDYPRTNLGYAFEITEPAVNRILPRARMGAGYHVVTVCRKDSQDVTSEDREKLANTCCETRSKRILITHGTDTMLETAAFLSRRVTDKTIVLTGAFLPETFKSTDADFNVGFALGVLSTLSTPGVYIAMNGQVSLWSKCTRNKDTDMFGGTLI